MSTAGHPTASRLRPRIALGGVGVLIIVVLLVLSLLPPRAVAVTTLFGGQDPKVRADEDSRSVELGVTFSSDVPGTVAGVRFFKSPENAGPHTGTLWDTDGKALATVAFDEETSSGWQEARFDQPVAVAAGHRYVASYRAPSGRYAGDVGGFSEPFASGHLSVPIGGGVYSYEDHGMPSQVWQNANYYVDVLFSPTADAPAPAGNPKESDPIDEPATDTTTTEPPAADRTTLDPPAGPLNLPRIPWEGRTYWSQFPKAKAAGWSDPNFFPVVNWWSVASHPDEVAFDKTMGINTYAVTNPDADYRLIEDGGMYWIGGKLPGATDDSKNWVGSFLDDEVDGRYEPADGFALLAKLSAAADPAKTGRFRYANYTSLVASYDMKPAVANKYANAFTDAVSMDQYFYGVPQCDWGAASLRWSTPQGQTGITPANCRTSSSYGKIVSLLRERDATDGRLQSIWNFVQVVGDEHRLDYDKVQGQVMSSLIHEARGIVWFPQSFSGGCETGNAFRSYQMHESECLEPMVKGARKINLLIKDLAPVLNTQTYSWNFGKGIDAMLKVKGDSAYVFAMTRDGGTGSRTFALPPKLNGTTVEVVGEDRTIAVSDHQFSDSFAKESSYHVYKIDLTD